MLKRQRADHLMRVVGFAIAAGTLWFFWSERSLVSGVGLALSLVAIAANHRLGRGRRGEASAESRSRIQPIAHPRRVAIGLSLASAASLALCIRSESRDWMLAMFFLAVFFALLAARLLVFALAPRRS